MGQRRERDAARQQPASYPAAAALQQVHLDGLHAAVVAARVDLKRGDRSVTAALSQHVHPSGWLEGEELALALTMFWWTLMHITMSLCPPYSCS